MFVEISLVPIITPPVHLRTVCAPHFSLRYTMNIFHVNKNVVLLLLLWSFLKKKNKLEATCPQPPITFHLR